jgi:hypothetical protein
MAKIVNIAKNLLLLSLPVAFVVVGHLRAEGVKWASDLVSAAIGLVAMYLLILCPNTIAFVLVSVLPLGVMALGFWGLTLWSTHWLLPVFTALAIRALIPIAFSEQIEQLRVELELKSKRENKPLVDGVNWLLGDHKQRN